MFDTLNNKLFRSYKFKYLIIDVNSMFLFTKQPTKNLYSFIDEMRTYFGSNLKVINVIDNGQNKKISRKFKSYKANRKVSQFDTDVRIQNTKNKYKKNIYKIINIDLKFENNLTFYYEGEADFKIGFILKYLNNLGVNRKQVLTCSTDKDLILSVLFSCVLLRTTRAGKIKQFFFDDDVLILNDYVSNYVDCLKFRKIYDWFYYLLLQGDKIDNIKRLCNNKIELCKIFNILYNEYGSISIENIFKLNIFNENDIIKNAELIDIYNNNAFTKHNIEFMKRGLDDFLKR